MRVSAISFTRPEPLARGRPTRPVCASSSAPASERRLDSAERAPCPSTTDNATEEIDDRGRPTRGRRAGTSPGGVHPRGRSESARRREARAQAGLRPGPEGGSGREGSRRRGEHGLLPAHLSLARARIGGAILGLAFALVCAVATKGDGRTSSETVPRGATRRSKLDCAGPAANHSGPKSDRTPTRDQRGEVTRSEATESTAGPVALRAGYAARGAARADGGHSCDYDEPWATYVLLTHNRSWAAASRCQFRPWRDQA